ncbi:MAG: 50S ribosomal protein L17 [Bacteroidales bacterium]|nr:50S ribosomal protein L17 [Bacteroidales bacterium]
MRHGCKVNHLSRTSAHRKAMLSNMAASLILYKRIETTLAKAKALRGYVEPLINRAKLASAGSDVAVMRNNQRVVFSYLHNKEAVHELFSEVGPKVAGRNGGYTRILKTGIRHGDNSEMCMMEIVDYNENMLKEATVKKTKTTRRSRSKKAADAVVAEVPQAEVKSEEAPKAE